MKIVFINIFCFFATTACGLSWAQTQKSLVGFQGVSWGSAISAVREKFPSSKQMDVCKYLADGTNNYDLIKRKMHEDGISCLILELDNYIVDGIKFLAKFSFNPQNRLRYVTLSFQKNQSDGQEYLSDCTSTFNRVANLLQARYGEAVGVANQEEFGRDYINYSVKAWLPLPTEIWIANLSGSKLSKRLAEISKKPESDICTVKVNYSKKVSDEALKL